MTGASTFVMLSLRRGLATVLLGVVLLGVVLLGVVLLGQSSAWAGQAEEEEALEGDHRGDPPVEVDASEEETARAESEAPDDAGTADAEGSVDADADADADGAAADAFDDDAAFGGRKDAPAEVKGANDERGATGKGSLEASESVSATTSGASSWVQFRVAGYAAAEGRVFFEEPRFIGQNRGDGVSLVVEPELSVSMAEGTHLFTARPFYRLDPVDPRRSHFDVRRADYRLTVAGFEAGLGMGQFSWGALESHRPSDVVNQIDFVERIDGTAKLGQPYIGVGYVGESLALRLMYLPYFRERTFHGLQGRLRFPSVVAGQSEFDSDLGVWHPSGAARLSIVAGDFDIGIAAFSGLSREPRFIAQLTSLELFPRYDQMHQASADATWTYGPVSLKAEGFFRLWSEELRYFGGGGGGIDYNFFNLFGSGADLSLVAEALYDSRGPDAPITFFDSDAFGGMRLAIGDAGDTVVQGGVVVDVFDATLFGRVGAQRRFLEHWLLSVDGNFYHSRSEKLEAGLAGDSHVKARVAYHF